MEDFARAFDAQNITTFGDDWEADRNDETVNTGEQTGAVGRPQVGRWAGLRLITGPGIEPYEVVPHSCQRPPRTTCWRCPFPPVELTMGECQP